jgi:SAM-dependent methyltransferase
MYAVTGSVDHNWFIEGGVLAVQSLCEILARHDRNLDSMSSVLEFGCGCGRVLRHLHYLPGRLSGCDWNRQSIRWCRENLPFADFANNTLEPPLPYPDDTFDLAYALSVFTHLGEDFQRPWMRELNRVVKPGGLVALSTTGGYRKDQLSSVERRRFDSGAFVARREQGSGTNLCSAFHPEDYLRGAFTRGFRLLEHVPAGALGNPRQDLTLLQRPDGKIS